MAAASARISVAVGAGDQDDRPDEPLIDEGDRIGVRTADDCRLGLARVQHETVDRE
jgi:hypothetical protein